MTMSGNKDFRIKAWSIAADGFQPYTYYAASRARALRDAWHGYCNYRQVSFKDWLLMARCSKRDDLPDEFGQAITVGGKPAFFVTSNSQYVQFVRPYAIEVFNAHPYDVEPEHMRPWTYRKEPTP